MLPDYMECARGGVAEGRRLNLEVAVGFDICAAAGKNVISIAAIGGQVADGDVGGVAECDKGTQSSDADVQKA